MNAQAAILCVLGSDRHPANCVPAQVGGVFRDLDLAAVQLADRWRNPAGEWTKLQPGTPILIILRFQPASSVVSYPTFDPPRLLPSGLHAPSTWTRWAQAPSLEDIAAAVPVEPDADRDFGRTDCVVGEGGRLEQCKFDPHTGHCVVDGVRQNCVFGAPGEVPPDPAMLKLTELLRAPAVTPSGRPSIGRHIYFVLVMSPVMDRLPPPPKFVG